MSYFRYLGTVWMWNSFTWRIFRQVWGIPAVSNQQKCERERSNWWYSNSHGRAPSWSNNSNSVYKSRGPKDCFDYKQLVDGQWEVILSSRWKTFWCGKKLTGSGELPNFLERPVVLRLTRSWKWGNKWAVRSAFMESRWTGTGMVLLYLLGVHGDPLIFLRMMRTK